MDLELTGKVAVITGASRGVGKAIARELAKEGVDVAICARHREALEEAAGELEQETGRRILPVPTDTTNWESVRRMVETTAVTLGRVDILVNNAATPGGLVRGALADASDEALLEDIDTKVIGYFRCAKAVAPYMQRQGWGRIINIGGLSGRQSAVHQWHAQRGYRAPHQDALRSVGPRRHHSQPGAPRHHAYRAQ